MTTPTPDYEALYRLQQQLQAPGAITAKGIREWWQVIIFIIIGAISVGGWLVATSVSAATKMNNIENDIRGLKDGQASVVQLRSDQIKTSGEVRELQIAVSAITNGQKELAGRMDTVSGDVRAVGQQVQAIAQAMRSRP